MRYLGVLLYDADRVHEAASAENEKIYMKAIRYFLKPFDEEVIEQAEKMALAMNGLKQLKIHQCINWQLNIN